MAMGPAMAMAMAMGLVCGTAVPGVAVSDIWHRGLARSGLRRRLDGRADVPVSGTAVAYVAVSDIWHRGLARGGHSRRYGLALSGMSDDLVRTKRFAGKVVIVTGAGQGIGRAYAGAFATEGASVAVADIDGVAASQVAAELAELGAESLACSVDVADEESVKAMAEGCVARFGGIDILVNNAGLHMGQYNLCIDLPLEDWRRLFDVNLLGAVLCARYCRPSMADRGGGVILNQSSSSAPLGVGAYSISKLALNGLTLSLAQELGADSIRVVGVAPGMVASPAVLARLEDHHKSTVLDGQIIKRFADMDDLLGMVLFLCSDQASFITGQTMLVDGGYVRHV
jgi:3-oxoacyl-[acyl-carrier protein] reductase